MYLIPLNIYKWLRQQILCCVYFTTIKIKQTNKQNRTKNLKEKNRNKDGLLREVLYYTRQPTQN